MTHKFNRNLVAFFVTAVMISSMVGSKEAQASDPFVGQIQMVGFNFTPRGWAHCDGQLLAISQHSALFSLLGTTFGGDGRTTFGLPDLRGRMAIHPGEGPGLSRYQWGEKGGAESVTLTVANLPSHSHSLNANSGNGTTDTPTANTVLARKARTKVYSTSAPNVDMATGIGATGGGQTFEIRQPSLGIYHVIALLGIFPSRN
jgi:microcystin-dependent protein